MRHGKAFTLIEVIVLVVVLAALLTVLFVVAVREAREKALRAWCMKCHRQIGLTMFQYAGDHDDNFMPLVDSQGNKVPAVAADGTISKEPARSGFAVLLKEGYLTTTKLFICPASTGRAPEYDWNDVGHYKDIPLKDLLLKEDECSFGWDPTKNHSADATCAIVADAPPNDVSLANEGTRKNNSDNHGKRGQCVFYNDGHVKWGTTPVPDSGDDPDIYTGAPGYETSPTDAKIIR